MLRECFVYLSGPMTAKGGHSVEHNVADGVSVYLRLLRQGIPCFCPHLSGAFPTAWTALDHATWLAYDESVIDRCTHLLMLARWETSVGADHERRYAISKGLPIAYSEEELIATLANARKHDNQ